MSLFAWQTSKLEILFSCLQFAFSFKKNDGEDFIYFGHTAQLWDFRSLTRDRT